MEHSFISADKNYCLCGIELKQETKEGQIAETKYIKAVKTCENCGRTYVVFEWGR